MKDPVGYTAKNPVMSFNRYMYVNNNPYKYTDPDGEWLQAVYGAIAGAVGGYVASGEGFTNTVVGMAAGAAGQALGSTATVALETGELPSLSDVKIDAVTTIAGGLGAAGGGFVAKGIAGKTMKPIIGTKPLSQAGAPHAAGLTAGAVVEGAIIGTAEKVAPKIVEKVKGSF
jgi:hypothetical protein